MSGFFVEWGHLLTAMIVFAGLWLYVWSLDLRVKRLQQELKEEADD
ncbi:MAG TPA: CcmD family protein [Capsulimonadaceae bacterium]|jgi:CcmD family protein